MHGLSTWLWTARKLVISAFLVVHMSATLIYVFPQCAIRERFIIPACCYLLPLGLWQYWGMFCPDPARNNFTLEAEVVDAHGLQHSFAFPKLADYHGLSTIVHFRHSKYAGNLGGSDTQINRQFAARHAVRSLGLGPDAFPLNVSLIYQVWLSPDPGGPPFDPMTPPQPHTLARFYFESINEVRP